MIQLVVPHLVNMAVSCKEKKSEYARYFPLVELDTTYHFCQKKRRAQLVDQIPENFRFVLKVHQSVTTQEICQIS